MTRTDVSSLTQLGATAALPANPDVAVIERVPNSQTDTPYVVRFVAPEFTSLCPIVKRRTTGTGTDIPRYMAFFRWMYSAADPSYLD